MKNGNLVGVKNSNHLRSNRKMRLAFVLVSRFETLTAVMLVALALCCTAGCVGSRLIRAAKSGDVSAVQSALADGSMINETDRKGSTALMSALGNGNTSVAKLLIEKGANVNEKDADGFTALIIACNKGLTDIAQLLLEKGADVNVQSKNGSAPLFLASKDGHFILAKLLIEKGADVNGVSRKFPPICVASAFAREEIVRLLIEKGADVNLKNHVGKTAVTYAINKGRMNMAKLLIEKGAVANDETMNALKRWEAGFAQEWNSVRNLSVTRTNMASLTRMLSFADNYFCHPEAKIIFDEVVKVFQYGNVSSSSSTKVGSLSFEGLGECKVTIGDQTAQLLEYPTLGVRLLRVSHAGYDLDRDPLLLVELCHNRQYWTISSISN